MLISVYFCNLKQRNALHFVQFATLSFTGRLVHRVIEFHIRAMCRQGGARGRGSSVVRSDRYIWEEHVDFNMATKY